MRERHRGPFYSVLHESLTAEIAEQVGGEGRGQSAQMKFVRNGR